MKLSILAVFNTNSRCLIRIRTSWGLIGSKNKKQRLKYLVTVGFTIMKITKICIVQQPGFPEEILIVS